MGIEFISFIYLLAGITLALAIINLGIGLQKGGDKAYTFLGLMGICVGIYNILFPLYSTQESTNIISKIAMFFFIANFALLPWFLCYYTHYRRGWLQWLLTSILVLSFILLLIDNIIFGVKLWNIIGHIALIGIIIFGIKASLHQYKMEEKRAATLLVAALTIFGLLTIDDIFRVYFLHIYPFPIPHYILPFDYFLIFFMIVMGVRLTRDMQIKYNMEKTLLLKERRWGDLLQKVKLLVIRIGTDSLINYVNPHFLQITGYNQEEIIGKNYILLLPEEDKEEMLRLAKTINKPEELPYYQSRLLLKNGNKHIINWSTVGLLDENDDHINTISIGSDITQEKNAYLEIKQLKSLLEEENILLKAGLGSIPNVEKIVGKSDAIKYVLQRAFQVASTNTAVLLEGETGVGKELITNYIQQNGERNKKPFVKINCAAIPAELLESELFGHTKGAFTGADKMKKGLVEMADGGTLFLDEIGEFPINLQPKLLRFLQEGEFVSLGSETLKKVDVRIIAATNRELLMEIEKGNFRNDLYYRLYVYPITIPPLRNRADDIPELVDVFLQKYSKKHGKRILKVSKLVVDELKTYSWPGNIRELENIIERAVIISSSDTIKIKDISTIASNKSNNNDGEINKIISLEEMERNHIILALKKTGWQIHGDLGAAHLLGINPNTLRSRIKKLSINKP